MVLLSACAPRQWEYSVQTVDMPEVFLAQYRQIKGLPAVGDEAAPDAVDAMLDELEDDPELAAEVQQRASIEATLRLNRAGARGWELVGMHVEGNQAQFTFKRPGIGALEWEDVAQ
jgi:hypothetical protein